MITDAQAALRKTGIGASEIAAVCGLDPYRSALDVWLVKTGRKPPFAGNAHTRRGQAMEGLVLDMYHERTGLVLARPDENADADSQLAGHFRHANAIQFCHLDAWTIEEPTLVVEAKVSDADGWGDDGTDTIPDPYVFQVQQQMACCGAMLAHVVRYSPQRDLLTIHPLDADSELQEIMSERAMEFWRYVKNDTVPPSDDGKGLALAYGVKPEAEVEIPEDLARAYDEAKKAEKTAEDAKSKALAAIEHAMQGAQFARAGLWTVRRSLVKGREMVSTDLLREKHPDVWKSLATRAADHTRITVTPPKEKK